MDWQSILWGKEEWSFILQVLLRAAIMFIIVLVALRIMGKRGIKQLSVFELVIILCLGSAASEPMIYTDVGIIPALLVFLTIIILYKAVTWMVVKSKSFEHLVEGKPVCLIDDGRFCIADFEKEDLAQDEFFAELRIEKVSQLGQVEKGILETTGDLSLFFYPDDKVKHGLPILPHEYETKNKVIKEEDIYACTFCGNTEKLKPAPQQDCPVCGRFHWIKATNRKRIS
jgi:uncharacterized membrane protein YcaP (DUF421 family)